MFVAISGGLTGVTWLVFVALVCPALASIVLIFLTATHPALVSVALIYLALFSVACFSRHLSLFHFLSGKDVSQYFSLHSLIRPFCFTIEMMVFPLKVPTGVNKETIEVVHETMLDEVKRVFEKCKATVTLVRNFPKPAKNSLFVCFNLVAF